MSTNPIEPKVYSRYSSSSAGANRSGTSQAGFSLIELIVSMVLTLIILGIAVATFSGALGSRERESSKTDALTSAQAALNIMSREIGNSGYGLNYNGIGGDSTDKLLHCRANLTNNNMTTSDPGEDVVFYLEGSGANKSVVRYDNNTGVASGIINRVSDVTFKYNQNAGDPNSNTSSSSTARVRIALTVFLADARGQPTNQTVVLTSDVTLRNSPYMLGQY